MTSPDKNIKVDPDALDAVANKIQDLADQLSGKNGAYPGNVPDFSQHAGDIRQPLSTFWDKDADNVLADAYAEELKGIIAIYTEIGTQLGSLATAAKTTASQYRKSDQNNADQMSGLNQ
jgi:hypothetical protein